MERPPLFIWPVHASCSTKKVKQCAAIPHPESATGGGSPGASCVGCTMEFVEAHQKKNPKVTSASSHMAASLLPRTLCQSTYGVCDVQKEAKI